MTAANDSNIAKAWGFPGLTKFPGYDFSVVEVPAAFRDFAEKGLVQAKENYDKMKSAAEEATDAMEATYVRATKGFSDYGLKMIEAARTNANANFDFMSELFGARSVSHVVELSTSHARKQFETISGQSRELTALAQQVATETSEPIKGTVSKAFNKAA